MLKNVVEKSQTVKIDKRYDLSFQNMQDLLNAYGDKPVDLLSAAFNVGYLQGTKAEREKRREASLK